MSTSVVPASSTRPARCPQRRAVTSAPMRVSFAGGGSDLPPFVEGLPGRVVGSAIGLRVRALVEPFDRGWVRLEVPVADEATTRRCHEPPSSELAFRLLEAALARTGVADGVRLRIDTDVAPGAGLGGSASAAVAALSALRWSVGEVTAEEELARDATVMEREGLSIVCGAQDAIFAACGGMLDLAFGEAGCTRIDRITPDEALAAELEAGLLLVDTHVRRVSGEVLEQVDAAAALANVAELVASAAEVVEALREGSLGRALEGMRRSAVAKVRRAPSASALATELGERLAGLGVEVIRACGAGGGGHVLVWAPEARHAEILRALGPATVRRPALAAPGVRIEPV
ncbi:hypothetical protein [Polyangium spumosum]|uniref:GHMP kinase N-terminal domain-containing protein n=1 Tax=Polyangium spumosum TaxID=889282 RepID=A0A6N7PU26_9BACT|nr:hypothetical protein [Polyangium spumosum]MRG94296.1 hypothetical protein [Polyangium spumosum]